MLEGNHANLRILSELLTSHGLMNKSPLSMSVGEIQKMCVCVMAATPHIAISELPAEAHELIENVYKVFGFNVSESSPQWRPRPDVSNYGIPEKKQVMNMINAGRESKGLPPLTMPDMIQKACASDKTSFKAFIHLLIAWGLDRGRSE